jgi:hypothetical protein
MAMIVAGLLASELRDRQQRVHHQLMTWTPDELLSWSDEDVVAVLKSVALVECPVLNRSAAYMLDTKEEVHKFRVFDDLVDRVVTIFTLMVPFTGDEQVFHLKASTYTLCPPEFKTGSDRLWLTYVTDGIRQPTEEEIRKDFDSQLDEIERHLEFARNDIRPFQFQIEQQLPGLVAQRRAKLLKDRQLNANIGFPVRRRNDADTYAVPIRRAAIPVRSTPAAGRGSQFEPEPAIADGDYEAALKVLLNMRNALERNPSTAQKMNEEEIRNLLLVGLNAQFEGDAAGEVFNCTGKTDILIRAGDRNVFIGECKIYKGPKTITAALDQLLGYLTWRDTKAALLLFIRDGDVTSIIDKAVAMLEEHPNFKRAGAIRTEDRVDVVVHANGDPAREIRLALLPFLVGAAKNPVS